MPRLNYWDFKRRVKSAEAAYVILGEESFCVQAAANHLKQLLSARFGERLSYSVRDAKSPEGTGAFFDDLRTRTFGFEHALIVVDRAENLLAQASFKTALGDYARHPSPFSTLALVCSPVRRYRDKLTLTKGLDSMVTVVDCPRPRDATVLRWLMDTGTARGIRITKKQAEMLMDLAGSDLAVLSGELDKLATYTGPNASLGSGHVEELAGRSTGGPAWEILDLVVDGRRSLAMRRAIAAAAQGQRASQVIWVLTDRLLGLRRRDPDRFADASVFERSVRCLAEADQEAKSSVGSDELILVRLVARLISELAPATTLKE